MRITFTACLKRFMDVPPESLQKKEKVTDDTAEQQPEDEPSGYFCIRIKENGFRYESHN